MCTFFLDVLTLLFFQSLVPPPTLYLAHNYLMQQEKKRNKNEIKSEIEEKFAGKQNEQGTDAVGQEGADFFGQIETGMRQWCKINWILTENRICVANARLTINVKNIVA